MEKTKKENKRKIKGLFSVKQFARIVGRDRQTIYRSIWSHSLKALKQNGHWRIPGYQAALMERR
jgi:hypothetical protein